MFVKYYKSPMGLLKITATDEALCSIEHIETQEADKVNTITKKVVLQLEEYFKGERQKFDINMALEGTDFQKQVWQALSEIPYGETWSYKELAEYIGNSKAVRAVGGANNKNPISIIVPCHRVIGANKKLVGYAGGLDRKEYLLKLENRLSSFS